MQMSVLVLAALASTSSVLTAQGPAATTQRAPGAPAFVENRGQWPASVRFRARSGPATAFFVEDGIVLSLDKHAEPDSTGPVERNGTGIAPRPRRVGTVAIALRFCGARRTHIAGEQPLPGVSNFYLGDDRARWVQGALGFARLRYAEIHPGVDLIVRERGGALAYDLELAPGADLAQIEIRVEGADSLRVLADGSLVIGTALGDLRQTPPRSFELLADGARRPVASRFELCGEASYRFLVPARDPARPLLVDPSFAWSSFLGGSGVEFVLASTSAGGDRVALVGETTSTDFPVTMGMQNGGMNDAFVVLIDPTKAGAAQLCWSTYLGGSDWDYGFDVDHDPGSALGEFAVAGMSQSTDFPTTMNAYQGANLGTFDGTIVLLDAQGALTYGTFVGSTGHDRATDVVWDASSGVVTLAGYTDGDPPTTSGALQPARAGGFDAYLAQLAPGRPSASQLVRATFLGGSQNEAFFNPATLGNFFPGDWDHTELHVGQNGQVTIGMRSFSRDFPTTAGCFQPANRGGWDVVVARLDPTLGGLRYSTHLGGAGADGLDGMSVDESGDVFLAGWVWDLGFPVTPNAYDTTFQRDQRNDGFVSWLSPQGNGSADLAYSTFLGDFGYDFMSAVYPDRSGILTVVGSSSIGASFVATPGAQQTQKLGESMACVLRLDPRGNGEWDLHYLSYLGAGGQSPNGISEWAYTANPLPRGRVFVSGSTDNQAFPVSSTSFQPAHGGALDGWVGVLELLPVHVTRLGVSTPACSGPLWTQVNRDPRRGDPLFEVSCNEAPPNAIGAVLINDSLGSGVYGGASVVIDPRMVFTASVGSDRNGSTRTRLPIPPTILRGSKLYLQHVFINTPSCGNGTNTLSASEAVTLQF